jgi:hypothetical protein
MSRKAKCMEVKMRAFSNEFLALAHSEPSATQIAAVTALQLWALLPAALAHADATRNEGLAFRLSLLRSALSLPTEGDE